MWWHVLQFAICNELQSQEVPSCSILTSAQLLIFSNFEIHTSFFISFAFFRVFWNDTDCRSESFSFRFWRLRWACLLRLRLWVYCLSITAVKVSLVVSFSSKKRVTCPICRFDDLSNNSTGVGPLPVLISPFLRFSHLTSRRAELVMS